MSPLEWAALVLVALAAVNGALGLVLRRLRREVKARRAPKVYGPADCPVCGESVYLDENGRTLAHNPPGEPLWRTCMGSYLFPNGLIQVGSEPTSRLIRSDLIREGGPVVQRDTEARRERS